MHFSRSLSVAVASFAFVGLASLACEKRENPATTTTPNTTTETPRAAEPVVAPAPAVTLAKDDQDFVTKATQGGLLEVALGREVADKALSSDVKAFGNKMVADHTKANDELKALAQRKGVTPPTLLDKEHQSKVDEYAKLSGAKFDKKYTSDMVDDHEEDVKEFRKASTDLKDPEIRDWAAKTLPTLEQHLTLIKDVKGKMNKN